MIKEDILKILDKPSEERIGSRFNSDLINYREDISDDLISRINKLFPDKTGISKLHGFGFLINLAYASSKLEGNSYSQLDTEKLIDNDIAAQGKSLEDTKMIISHKNAFSCLTKAKKVSFDLVLDVHAHLANNAGVEGSRHFLDPEWCGKIRTYKDIWIGGSTYLPPVDYPGSKLPKISDYLTKICKTGASIQNPLRAALYLFTRLPYLQAFDDCNKRTSRFIGNLPLLLANDYPISFLGFDKSNYNKGLVAFYEFGYTDIFKEGLIRAYVDSALKLHGFSHETLERIKSESFQYVLDQASTYILNGSENKISRLIVNDSISLSAHKGFDRGFNFD